MDGGREVWKTEGGTEEGREGAREVSRVGNSEGRKEEGSSCFTVLPAHKTMSATLSVAIRRKLDSVQCVIDIYRSVLGGVAPRYKDLYYQ